MIERFYLKDYLSFKEISLEFNKNLVIFSGPSGAGKSILMEAILAVFGLKDCGAKVIEATLSKKIDLDSFGIEESELNIFKQIREKSVRFFINNQQVSKKNLGVISSQFLNYLTLREFKEFENERVLSLLDAIILKDDKEYQQILDSYKRDYELLLKSRVDLEELEKREQKIEELKEFTEFEISKIESIDPKVGEYEELLSQKRELSHKEKIESALKDASLIFEYESKVDEVLSLLDEECIVFSEALNELRALFESATLRVQELDELNIEKILDRLDKLSSLKRKHGSIENSLEYLKQKKEELLEYNSISFKKEELLKSVLELDSLVKRRADILTKKRVTALKILNRRVEHYLKLLYLQNLEFQIDSCQLKDYGQDSIKVSLKGADLQKVSSGELNRVRLAMLCASSEFVQDKGGILILDEIDANLSGKESMSIAVVLQLLSKSYQIFAISHQPQLSSKAQMHFLVDKVDGISRVVELKRREDRAKELSRMISGDSITKEAMEFANTLLEE